MQVYVIYLYASQCSSQVYGDDNVYSSTACKFLFPISCIYQQHKKYENVKVTYSYCIEPCL